MASVCNQLSKLKKCDNSRPTIFETTLNLDKISHAMHFQQQLIINACMK